MIKLEIFQVFSFYGRVELRVSSEIMSLKIVKNTGVTWIENTHSERSEHFRQHGSFFDRIFELEETPSLKFNAKLCFGPFYHSDPIFEIKVIEGFEELKDFDSLHVSLECSSIRDSVLYKADTFFNPSLESVKNGYRWQEDWQAKNEETACYRPFGKVTGNYMIDNDRVPVIPITYVIKLRKQEFKISSLSKRLSEKLFLNDELSDVKIHCHGKVFDCHKVQYS